MARNTGALSPRMRVRIYLILIVIVAILGGFFVYPPLFDKPIDFINAKLGIKLGHFWNRPFTEGLDLQGGSQLIYEADVSKVPAGDRNDSLAGVRDVIERRVNAFGVAEPLVQTTKSGDKYRVVVELAGIKDVNQAIQMIGETPLLEFKEQAAPQTTLTAVQKADLEKFNADAKKKAQDILSQVLKAPATFSDVARQKSEDTATSSAGGDLGFIKDGGTHSEFLTPVKQVGVGEIYYKIFENSEGYNVLKRGENKSETEVKAAHVLICFKGATSCTSDLSKEDALKKIQDLKAQATPQNFASLVKANSTEPGADQSAGELGWFSKGMMVKAFEDVVFAQKVGTISDVVETEFGYHLIYKEAERQTPTYQVFRILIKKETESDILPKDQFAYTGLTGKDLKKAAVQINPETNEPEVTLEFTDAGAKLFSEITGRNVGKIVAIYLDGQAISTPTVNSQITGGKAVISGKFNLDEAKILARRLNAGALPVPINLVSQSTVGASLGQQFVGKGLNAALLAFLLIALFMIFYYRLPGLLSVVALIIYTIINLAIYKLVPVTMTLSGIAGFVLSVGMAVDANVLIFERLKEELGQGKPLASATEEAFRRAWPSIRDGNYTTLLSCFFLYWFGTSIIKGFALTLFIGVILSMLSAITITKTFMRTVNGWGFTNRLNWLFLRQKNKNLEQRT
ncbi:MAG: protein translocase subunit SecD [Patescibacteria group bacterium]|nr:protein translocase subunit SecD [Patescibacteria group bacterium]